MLVCSCKSKLHVVGVDGRYGVAELVSQEQLLGARGGHSTFKGVTACLSILLSLNASNTF